MLQQSQATVDRSKARKRKKRPQVKLKPAQPATRQATDAPIAPATYCHAAREQARCAPQPARAARRKRQPMQVQLSKPSERSTNPRPPASHSRGRTTMRSFRRLRQPIAPQEGVRPPTQERRPPNRARSLLREKAPAPRCESRLTSAEFQFHGGGARPMRRRCCK